MDLSEEGLCKLQPGLVSSKLVNLLTRVITVRQKLTTQLYQIQPLDGWLMPTSINFDAKMMLNPIKLIAVDSIDPIS